MKVKFEYTGWAPWNDHLYSDSLRADVVRLLEDWYGPGFTKVKDSENPRVDNQYIKIDDTRRILVSEYTDRAVVAMFTDVVAEKQVESQED